MVMNPCGTLPSSGVTFTLIVNSVHFNIRGVVGLKIKECVAHRVMSVKEASALNVLNLVRSLCNRLRAFL